MRFTNTVEELVEAPAVLLTFCEKKKGNSLHGKTTNEPRCVPCFLERATKL